MDYTRSHAIQERLTPSAFVLLQNTYQTLPIVMV